MQNFTLPTFTGTGKEPALHEIHIFLKCLNPDQKTLDSYYEAVAEWNEQQCKTSDKMKACYLALVFRDPEGNENVVKVMQSARYIRSNCTSDVVSEASLDSDWFENHGLSVIRVKVEAKAYGIKEIPLETKDVTKGMYFEFHIKVGRKDRDDDAPIRDSEIDDLRQISRDFSQQFKVPVPLSYNENKNKVNQDGQGHQRFLNLRSRNGRNICTKDVEMIKEAIDTKTKYKVLKVIREYVWFDTYTKMDQGWIDYSKEELTQMYA